MPEVKQMTVFEYGAMSSKYSCMAENKLTAYCTIVLHYDRSAHLVMLYNEDCKADVWTNFEGKIAARLDEIFGGPDSFDKYCEDNAAAIAACYKTIKRIV
jgi:hypothetical protein